MSILIKGIEMPQDEEMLCIDIYPSGKVCIALDLESNQIATAVPVPPHGDLIDRDEQIERAWRLNLSTRELLEEMLKSAPTIIPADPQKEEAE